MGREARFREKPFGAWLSSLQEHPRRAKKETTEAKERSSRDKRLAPRRSGGWRCPRDARGGVADIMLQEARTITYVNSWQLSSIAKNFAGTTRRLTIAELELDK